MRTTHTTRFSCNRIALRLVPLLLVLLFGLQTAPLDAARLKDITHVQGVRTNQLIGYGLVVGLNKSGDDQKVLFTVQSLTSMLSRMGIRVNPADIRARNVAAVVVTASLPPFASAGNTLDIQVASIGNAKSLQGGTLLMTPLRGTDGQIFAIAQGSLSLGGYSFAGGSGTSVQKNHPTVARIPGGAIIEREIHVDLNAKDKVVLSLLHQDFTTATRVAQVVNDFLAGPFAKARDAGAVVVRVPREFDGRVVDFMAQVENLNVTTDRRARVVMNERTGTVIMGADVRISTIAIAHGSLKVQISNSFNVSQPAPFSQGKTTTTPESSVQAVEEKRQLAVVREGVTLGEVVMALNAIGVSPRDLIDILQAIKAAGALEAEIEIL